MIFLFELLLLFLCQCLLKRAGVVEMEVEVGVVAVAVAGRAEIDTRAPFSSVREAVALFGEKVLAGEVYANKLKEIQEATIETGNEASKLSTVTTELEEAKESLMKAREESLLMVTCLSSLREELEQTKRELEQMKFKELEKQPIDSETEDLKFVENSNGFAAVHRQNSGEGMEFQRKRYVKFASPPLAQVMGSSPSGEVMLERHPSMKKKKKKPLIPLFGGLFSKKKANPNSLYPRAQEYS